MKKIGFLISDHHLIAHGGIGQFCRSFVRMCNDLGHEVVLILDKKPKKSFYSEIDCFFAVYPDRPLSYDAHWKKYGRFEEGPNLDKTENFKTALSMAIELHDFDLILANSNESIEALATFECPKHIKRVLYTHLYKQVYPEAKFSDIFTVDYHARYDSFLFGDCVVGTQSNLNRDRLRLRGIDAQSLPMPMTELSLLDGSDHLEKSGVLYVGRWEPGKNPNDYLKIIKQTKLPAKVLTNSRGARKFQKAFEDMGHRDYEIKAGVIGQEKVDFLKHCKVFFNTSLLESYGYSVFEAIGHMPVVGLTKKKVPWSENFEGLVYDVDLKTAAQTITELYSKPNNNGVGLEFVNRIHRDAYESWNNIFNGS